MKLPLLKILCLAIAAINTPSAFALVELEDDALSETTGEGIAILPENFAASMNGADAANGGAGTYGTGYMRYIPVGPLTATATAKGYQKADAWLYGVSLAQSKTDYGATITSADWGVPFGAIGTAATDFGRGITSWGTAENPWLIKATTEVAPDFVGINKNVTHLDLIAPLYHSVLPASGSAASSAYNLKMAYWMDVWQRNSTIAEGVGATAYNGLTNRLRLAFAWDSFGVNGSNIKVFQTLDGVTPAMGGTYTALLKINGVPNVSKTFNYGMSTSYNKTFGMAGLLRLNSGATDTRRGVVSAQTVTREIRQIDFAATYPASVRTNTFTVGPVLVTKTGGTFAAGAETTAVQATNSSAGLDESYRPMTNGGLDPFVLYYPGTFPSGGVCTSAQDGNSNTAGLNQAGQCLTNEGFTTRRFSAFGTNTWTPPTTKSVMRISTQELATGVFGAGTPALGGASGTVPDFRPNASAEGIFLYDANINLVLGNLYQPLMLSTDGNNFSLELARIPNNVNVYSKIYTRYPGDTGDGAVTYQGSTCNIHQCSTAPVTYGGVNYQGSSATHSSITIGSTVYSGAGTNQLTAYSGVEAYGVSIGELQSGTLLSSSTSVDYTQVWNRTRVRSGGGWTAWPATWNAVLPKAAVAGQPHPSLNRPNPYETTFRQDYNNQILGIQTTMPVAANMVSTINAMTPTGATVFNNFGSVVIDGLLIQHLKFSTTGL
ncbi:hypothetical protein FK216_10500 [Moraxellaceae bacterium AER2_44_116]|nr:hypothetical protein [Moraxellaceae bacterium]TQC96995.1 hypothetical protein FK216_10500 [Moraxellaceae bacterium AER2_44_116]